LTDLKADAGGDGMPRMSMEGDLKNGKNAAVGATRGKRKSEPLSMYQKIRKGT